MSTSRRFKIIQRVNDVNAAEKDTIVSEYIVTDAKDLKELESSPGKYIRKPIAIFPVSTHHDSDSQNELAKKLVSFLNNIRDAEEEAVKNNELLNQLK